MPFDIEEALSFSMYLYFSRTGAEKNKSTEIR